MIVVRTHNVNELGDTVVSHAWVGGKLVQPRADGTFDPIDVACAQLRADLIDHLARTVRRARSELGLRYWWPQ